MEKLFPSLFDISPLVYLYNPDNPFYINRLMLRVFLFDRSFYVYDKSEKDFREKYGRSYEQVGIINDMDNLDPVLNKLTKTYRPVDIYFDFHRISRMSAV
jgi:hypothetical protein